MKFQEHIETVNDCENEADLSHEWLKPIVSKFNGKKTLKLRWEKKNQKNRKDLALGYAGREICVIELKSPKVDKLEDHFLQIHRYIYAQNYWRDGELNPALGILTNGKTALIIDGRKDLQTAIRTFEKIDLTTQSGFTALCEIITKLTKGKRGHRLHSPIEKDSREKADDVIEKLSKDLMRYYNSLKTKRGIDPFDVTLQIFLVAVLRDCGYIPTALMQQCYEDKKWAALTKALNKILSSNFSPLPNKEHLIEMVYQETRTLCARLDVVPPDCLGLVYEGFLHQILKDKAVTSYYTPHSLAMSVIKRLDINRKSKIVDPSCGSGTFLTSSIEYLFGEDSESGVDRSQEIFKFLKNNLRGIDRDDGACQVAKAMLLACASQHCGLDPAKRELELPNLKDTIICSDFFLLKTKFQPTHVIGNAPWGGVDDNKKKDHILPSKVRSKAKINDDYKCYYRNVDVSALFLERIVKLFPLAKIGMLVKQQSLHNDGSQLFLPWAKENEFVFHDFGDREFFNNPSSLTAIAYRHTGESGFIKSKGVKYPKISKNMVPLKKMFHVFEAFEANMAGIFLDVATRLKNKGHSFDFMVPMYPVYNESRHLKLPKNLKTICFIKNGKNPPQEFVRELTTSEKKALSSRSQVSQKYPYNFRGTEGYENYKFNCPEGIRVVMPINFNPIRARAMIDPNGIGIPIKDHSCVLIPKNSSDRDLVYCLVGWLNSKHFYFECLRSGLKRVSGGRMKFQGKEKHGVCIPQELLTPAFSKHVKGLLKKNVSEKDLDKLDNKILELCRNSNYFDRVTTLIEQEELLRTITEALGKAISKKKKQAS